MASVLENPSKNRWLASPNSFSRPNFTSRIRAIGTFPFQLTILLLALTFTTLLSRPVAADNYLMYYFLEEFPANSHIGDIVNDYGYKKRYNQSVLEILRFTILMQSNFDRTYVMIDEKTGVIRSTHKVDRETICPWMDDCTIKFDVAVKPIQHFEIVKVKVVILDMNDNFPTFPEPRVRHRMSESAELGSGFVIPAATDMDSGRNGIKRYEVDPVDGKFELVTRNGLDGETNLRLVLRENLNREVDDQHNVVVYAIDGGEPPKTGSILVDVTVQDVNDNVPEFENSSYQVSVSEDLPVGSVLLKVRATDRDTGPNGIVKYDFSKHTSHEHGSHFGIHSDSGKIFLLHRLDYETERIHLLSVTATDQGPDSLPTHASVIVRVEDVNDNSPSITVNTLTVDGQAAVEENSEPITFVAHISVLDSDSGDNGRTICVIDNNHYFLLQTIYSTEFKLVTSVTLDRERRDLYLVTITCRDHGHPVSLTSRVTLRVHVTDVNDHVPIFITSTHVSQGAGLAGSSEVQQVDVTVEENGEVGAEVMIAQAFDEDEGENGRIIYTLSDDVIDLLCINRTSGIVTSLVVFDREEMERVSFTVWAHDHGVPSRSSSLSVILTVTDQDDERPSFPVSLYSFTVGENEPLGTIVGTVMAVDRDLPPFDTFSYYIEQDASAQLFEIDSSSGLIRTRQTLDRELLPVHHLIVVASPDNDRLYTSATASVTIRVSDVNDNKPIFESPSSSSAHVNETIGVSSMSPPGHIVFNFKAVDGDTGSNANIFYSILEGNKRQLLVLDAYTGVLKVNKPLASIDFEDLVLTILARDGGVPSLSSVADLRVVISKDIPFVPTTPAPDGDTSFLRRSILADEGTVVALAVAFGAVLVSIAVISAVFVIVSRGGCNRAGYRKSEGTRFNGGAFVTGGGGCGTVGGVNGMTCVDKNGGLVSGQMDPITMSGVSSVNGGKFSRNSQGNVLNGNGLNKREYTCSNGDSSIGHNKLSNGSLGRNGLRPQNGFITQNGDKTHVLADNTSSFGDNLTSGLQKDSDSRNETPMTTSLDNDHDVTAPRPVVVFIRDQNEVTTVTTTTIPRTTSTSSYHVTASPDDGHLNPMESIYAPVLHKPRHHYKRYHHHHQQQQQNHSPLQLLSFSPYNSGNNSAAPEGRHSPAHSDHTATRNRPSHFATSYSTYMSMPRNTSRMTSVMTQSAPLAGSAHHLDASLSSSLVSGVKHPVENFSLPFSRHSYSSHLIAERTNDEINTGGQRGQRGPRGDLLGALELPSFVGAMCPSASSPSSAAGSLVSQTTRCNGSKTVSFPDSENLNGGSSSEYNDISKVYLM